MNKMIKTFSMLLFAALLLVACNKQPTIQEYYVQKQESNNFIAIDLPASLLKVGDEASQETKETMATIKKLNILAFKITEENKAEYEVESAEVKGILKGKKYNELMRMKHQNMNIIINYQGADEAINEFVLYAADNEKGFALARVLGNKMDPEKIMKMAQDLKNIDGEGASDAMAQITDLFGDIDFD